MESKPNMIKIRLFGETTIESNTAPKKRITKERKASELIAYLILKRSEIITRAQIKSAFLGDNSSDFSHALQVLREEIGLGNTNLICDRDNINIIITGLYVDIINFEVSVKLATGGFLSPQELKYAEEQDLINKSPLYLLTEAIDTFNKNVAPGIESNWIKAERIRLRDMCLKCYIDVSNLTSNIDSQQAERYLDKAIEINPRSIELFRAFAYLYSMSGDIEKLRDRHITIRRLYLTTKTGFPNRDMYIIEIETIFDEAYILASFTNRVNQIAETGSEDEIDDAINQLRETLNKTGKLYPEVEVTKICNKVREHILCGVNSNDMLLHKSHDITPTELGKAESLKTGNQPELKRDGNWSSKSEEDIKDELARIRKEVDLGKPLLAVTAIQLMFDHLTTHNRSDLAVIGLVGLDLAEHLRSISNISESLNVLSYLEHQTKDKDIELHRKVLHARVLTEESMFLGNVAKPWNLLQRVKEIFKCESAGRSILDGHLLLARNDITREELRIITEAIVNHDSKFVLDQLRQPIRELRAITMDMTDDKSRLNLEVIARAHAHLHELDEAREWLERSKSVSDEPSIESIVKYQRTMALIVAVSGNLDIAIDILAASKKLSFEHGLKNQAYRMGRYDIMFRLYNKT